MSEGTISHSSERHRLHPRFVPIRPDSRGIIVPLPHQPLPKAATTVYVPEARKPKLLDQVREAIQTRHYSKRTKKAYCAWVKRFIFFHNKRHPAEMGEAEIGQFLSSLAREGQVSASTQNQALNALLFLYQAVLGKKIGYL